MSVDIKKQNRENIALASFALLASIGGYVLVHDQLTNSQTIDVENITGSNLILRDELYGSRVGTLAAGSTAVALCLETNVAGDIAGVRIFDGEQLSTVRTQDDTGDQLLSPSPAELAQTGLATCQP